MIDEGVNELQPANTNWDQPLIIAEPEILVYIYILLLGYIYIIFILNFLFLCI